MRDTDVYTQILGLRLPWQVSSVELDRPGKQVTAKVADAMLEEGTETEKLKEDGVPSPVGIFVRRKYQCKNRSNKEGK